jgi:hypothetical protein
MNFTSPLHHGAGLPGTPFSMAHMSTLPSKARLALLPTMISSGCTPSTGANSSRASLMPAMPPG